MAWKCFMVEKRDGEPRKFEDGSVITPAEYVRTDGQVILWGNLPPGAMWFQGPLLFVRLPGINDWCIDRPGTGGARWTRAGEPPNVTATPSINFVGSYHGYVKDGVVTDDVEGRKFDDMGRPL